MSQKYLIGIDGGGTKTEIAVANLDGIILYTHTVASIRSGNVLEDKPWAIFAREHLVEKLESWSLLEEDCVSICLGLRDLNTSEQAEKVRNDMKEIMPASFVTVTDDSEIAYYAATGGAAGAMVIAGTGSVAFGSDAKGRYLKLGGHGPFFADEGSGYSIGREAVARAMLAAEGRGLPTVLNEVIPKIYFLDDMIQVRNHVNQPPFAPGKLAALVPLVKEAASAGDEVSNQILSEAGKKLGELAVAICHGLNLTEPKVYGIGKVLMLTPQVFESFYRTIIFTLPTATITCSSNSPVSGAVMIARKNYQNTGECLPIGKAWEFGRLPEQKKKA